ncbi:MAG: OB-fold domain-containing protein [Acidobacteria bacterium]|nr:OB-fold domain-containing protein [Acidobacteriota bacterium]
MAGNEWTLEFPYRRSVGPIVGEFLTALRKGELKGARTASGRVIVPALEYDPETGEPVEELVAVADHGTVTSFAWIAEPKRHQPLDRPFAFAHIRLEGADTDLFHLVDAGSEEAMSIGMAVEASWRDERDGSITDIAAFVPTGDA